MTGGGRGGVGHCRSTAVRRAFMLSGRLPATARIALTEGADGLAAVAARGRPAGAADARVARPNRSTPRWRDLGADVTVEYKLDGARIQVHRDGDEVRVYTRTLREITGSVPELVELVRGLPGDVGRARRRDPRAQRRRPPAPVPGHDEPLRRHHHAATLLLRPFFFDCLHLDGADLIDEPLSQRLDALVAVGRASTGSRACTGPPPRQAAALLDDALAAGHEGVMVKSLDAPYAAGRRGRGWQKVKPVHTLDLVVLGAEWGYGRRTGYAVEPAPRRARPRRRRTDHGRQDVQGHSPTSCCAWQTKNSPATNAPATTTRCYLVPELVVEIELDGVQRQHPLPGRGRAAVRPGAALPTGQAGRRRRHDRGGAGAATGLKWSMRSRTRRRSRHRTRADRRGCGLTRSPGRSPPPGRRRSPPRCAGRCARSGTK